MTKSFINYHSTHFVMSAPNIQHLPADRGREIAFVGRSNAGKSTALNTLTGQKSLARTSKTPGRTQLINLFQVTESAFLVDLPGYGYAAVPESVKTVWQQALYAYIQKRSCLYGLVLLMDSRHPLKELDQQMIQWSVQRALPLLLFLTKSDKLSYNAYKITEEQVRKKILDFKGDIQVERFSALKKVGVDKLRQKLDHWFSTA